MFTPVSGVQKKQGVRAFGRNVGDAVGLCYFFAAAKKERQQFLLGFSSSFRAVGQALPVQHHVFGTADEGIAYLADFVEFLYRFLGHFLGVLLTVRRLITRRSMMVLSAVISRAITVSARTPRLKNGTSRSPSSSERVKRDTAPGGKIRIRFYVNRRVDAFDDAAGHRLYAYLGRSGRRVAVLLRRVGYRIGITEMFWMP